MCSYFNPTLLATDRCHSENVDFIMYVLYILNKCCSTSMSQTHQLTVTLVLLLKNVDNDCFGVSW